jgi:hypothetical protein
MNAEINPVLARKKGQLQVLCYYLSEYCCNQNQNQNNKNNQNKNKSFYEMTRDDILGYPDNGRKTEESDPYHKWIDAYNLPRICLMGFIKWLYHQDIFDSKIRQRHSEKYTQTKTQSSQSTGLLISAPLRRTTMYF